MPTLAQAQDAPVDPQGHDAESPWAMPWPAWKAVLLRTWNESSSDNLGLIAAGVAFYGFLALVPLLGAMVLSYGIVADPQTVIDNMNSLTSVMPADAAKLIGEQLLNVVQTSDGKKGLGVVLALALALFGARNAAGAIVTALNIAYEEDEKRGIIRLNLLSLGITASGVGVALLAVVAIAALGHLESLMPTVPDALLFLGKLLSYVLLTLAGAAGAATLYRYAPSRGRAKWTWLTPGSLLAGLLWLVLTLGFGIYVANFGNYNATYGSLGGVVVLLTWMYLSSYILLFGGELNSELEHQTARDTTRGFEKPLGTRGAWVADHVADSALDGPPKSATKDPSRPLPPPSRELLARLDAATAAPAPPSVRKQLAVAGVTSKLGQLARMEKAGLAPVLLSTLGLKLLRGGRSARTGAILMVSAAGIAWLARERAVDGET